MEFFSNDQNIQEMVVYNEPSNQIQNDSDDESDSDEYMDSVSDNSSGDESESDESDESESDESESDESESDNEEEIHHIYRQDAQMFNTELDNFPELVSDEDSDTEVLSDNEPEFIGLPPPLLRETTSDYLTPVVNRSIYVPNAPERTRTRALNDITNIFNVRRRLQFN